MEVDLLRSLMMFLYWILDDWDRVSVLILDYVTNMPVVNSWFMHLDTVKAGTNSRTSG